MSKLSNQEGREKSPEYKDEKWRVYTVIYTTSVVAEVRQSTGLQK